MSSKSTCGFASFVSSSQFPIPISDLRLSAIAAKFIASGEFLRLMIAAATPADL